MPIYHIVLFKLKPNVSQTQIDEMRAAGEAMVGVVPGLRSFALGPPLASTAHRARGFDMALMTVLDTEEQVLAYAGHPAHQKLHVLREAVCIETLAYDLVAP
ncbi:stress responsive a b barrel domain protein [Colletotrichum musicola]|uniref:Stress responsive a b barrel domain protein n=1 Tax=Colletotrichum musicola TaxID=2175873 RepID=A0A8H6JBD7_9PEZI|nr:stress responsive a b barrel domain protein [Colletotrichum musicola]